MTSEPSPTVTYLLISAVLALGGVIVFLFKHYSDKLAARETADLAAERLHAAEREKWAAERQTYDSHRDKLRAEFEEKHRAVLERTAQQMTELFAAARAHEDMLRAEFLANADTARREVAVAMEAIAAKAADASDKIAVVLDKIFERFLGPRRPKG